MYVVPRIGRGQSSIVPETAAGAQARLDGGRSLRTADPVAPGSGSAALTVALCDRVRGAGQAAGRGSLGYAWKYTSQPRYLPNASLMAEAVRESDIAVWCSKPCSQM